MKFEVGKRYKTRSGDIVTITKIDSYILITGGDYKNFPLFLSGRNNAYDDRPMDLVEEVAGWMIGEVYVSTSPSYAGYKYKLVAINPEQTRPYVVRFGTSKLDLAATFDEDDMKRRMFKPAPVKVKVKLAFVDGDIYSATKRDSFISPLPHNAIVRDVEVEL